MSGAEEDFFNLASQVDMYLDALYGFALRYCDNDRLDEIQLNELATLVAGMADLKGSLQRATGVFEGALMKLLPVDGQVAIPNSSKFIEKKQGKSSTGWNHKALKALVAETVIEDAINDETGAVDRPLSEIIQNAFEFAGIGYWKKTALRDSNINPDLYSTPKDGKLSIRIIDVNQPKQLEPDEDFLV